MATDGPTHSETLAGNQSPAIGKKTLFTLFREWPLNRKIALGVITALSLAVFSFLIIQARVADYQLLYANLSEADAGSVVNWLKTKDIPYQLKNGGKNIWIGAEKIYDTRLDLAANGLPRGGDVGFEIFDKQSFALTDYVQKVNHTRALQGELARTITSLDPVESTRVHLAIPEKHLFKNQQKNPTASVIVSLAHGRQLDPDQVQGILHLVAGSITGLTPENVKIIDSNGVVLDGQNKRDSEELLTIDMLSFQQDVEQRLQMRAQDLLDTIMGKNKAMVRVTADLDFSKVEKTQELYDAEEPVVRSEQVNQESNGTQTTGGIPGVQSNLQGNIAELGNAEPPSMKSSRTTNYEISKTISKIVNPVGTIKSLSVSILVADRQVSGDGSEKPTSVPLTDEELKSIEKMVTSALGIIPERGDIINVVSMPFSEQPERETVAQQLPENLLYRYLPAIKIFLIAVGALLFYLLLVRPIIKTMKGEVTAHYKTVEEMERDRQQQIKAEEEELARSMIYDEDQVVSLRKDVFRNPVPTAYIVKNWIQEA
ncbi:MAG: flagellar basal-body MS-ring/collar protein FliF [Desulfocapsaceae bacterium]|jgi:flagellar M-ring protein FliF|nr:flagellar basal-body MS-ring/collar protein FliF [Desulfocapsaceae bacterium]